MPDPELTKRLKDKGVQFAGQPEQQTSIWVYLLMQSLPFLLDFSSDRGELLDKDGEGTGFTRTQQNKNGDQ